MSIEQEKMIVESLSSLYPLQEFEEKAIDTVLNAIPHWIPVTKDTPKEAGTYMCTCYDAGRRIVTLVKWQPRTKTWNLIGARAYWKVIAWRELPEPYKEVTE